MRVEALVAESPVEGFDVCILHGPTWSDEVDVYATLMCPLVEVVARKLASVVALDRRRYAAVEDDAIERARDVYRANARGNVQREALPTEDIDRCEDAKSSTRRGHVPHEVDRPPLVDTGRHGRSNAHASRALLAPFGPHLQTFFDV